MSISLYELFNQIKNDSDDYIVKLAYKYDWEEEYRISNEILTWDGSNNYIWEHDWNEGESDVRVLGFIKVEDIYIPDIKLSRMEIESEE